MKPFTWLSGYDRTSVPTDLVAAVTVWALLMPQALADGQLAGLPAVNGMYAALCAVALSANPSVNLRASESRWTTTSSSRASIDHGHTPTELGFTRVKPSQLWTVSIRSD